MTKRYYYTCPIKAAFMAKYHDIRFKCDIASSFTYYFSHNAMLCDSSERYHIHPDSVGLLEPMEGDVITDTDKEFYYVTREITCDKSPMVVSPDGVYDADIIIQRNGKAFHWPESEEV